MDNSGAGSYVYAKASGILGKSFIGPRAAVLFEQKNLSELWTLLFKTPAPLVPEVLLAEQIEAEAFKRFISQYSYFIKQYSNPHKILTAQFAVYEAENLKEVGAALCAGEKDCPKIIDLGEFTDLNFKAWPDIQKITKDSKYSWYDHVPQIHEQQNLEFKIDMQVINMLWNATESTKGEEHEALKKLFLAEYSIKNIVWALRLKIHYQMSNEEILSKLIYVTDNKSAMDILAAGAIEVLDMPVDDYNVWRNWRYSELINPMMDNGVWTIDPTWIERKNKIRVNKLSLHMFHQNPMSISSLVGWYRIKKFELSCIRTAVESLRLSVSSDVAKSTVGISTDEINEL